MNLRDFQNICADIQAEGAYVVLVKENKGGRRSVSGYTDADDRTAKAVNAMLDEAFTEFRGSGVYRCTMAETPSQVLFIMRSDLVRAYDPGDDYEDEGYKEIMRKFDAGEFEIYFCQHKEINLYLLNY